MRVRYLRCSIGCGSSDDNGKDEPWVDVTRRKAFPEAVNGWQRFPMSRKTSLLRPHVYTCGGVRVVGDDHDEKDLAGDVDSDDDDVWCNA